MSVTTHEKLKNGEHKCQCASKKSTVNVKFKKLHEDAVLPFYGSEFAAGMDCITVSDPEITDTYVGYKLGLAMEIPYGYVGYLFPRSSNSKKDLLLSNAVGVIDCDYRGEVQARFRDVNFSEIYNSFDGMQYMANQTKMYSKGNAVCQLIIMPVPKVNAEWVDELSETVRGTGGFGSSGN